MTFVGADQGKTGSGRSTVVLWALLGIAFGLFTWGATSGADQTFYVDEAFYDRYAFELARFFVGGGNATFSYVHPSGYSMILMAAYSVWYLLGRLTGEFGNLGDFLVRFAVSRSEFVVIARWISALFATAALPGVYLTARRIFSRDVGILAAVALAISYPVVFYAHIAANLTMLVCIAAWTMFFAVRVWQEGQLRDYLGAGALIGAGVGAKYYPVILSLSLGLAYLYRGLDAAPGEWRKILRAEVWKPVLAGLVAVPVALVLFPLPILANGQWLDSLRDTTTVYYTGGSAAGNALRLLFGTVPVFEQATAEPVSWWSNSLLVLSPVGLVWILVGLGWGLVCRKREALLLAGPVVLFFGLQSVRGGLSLGVRQLYFGLPGLWILAAACLAAASERLGRSRVETRQFLAIASVLLLFQPASWVGRFLVLSSRPSTVEVARAEVGGIVPAGAVLLVDSMAAPFGETVGWRSGRGRQTAGLGSAADKVREARRKAAPPFDVRPLGWGDAKVDLESLCGAAPSCFVALTDSFSTGYWDAETIRAWGNLNSGRAESRRRYLKELSARTEVVKVFDPRELRALGPVVTLFRVEKGA